MNVIQSYATTNDSEDGVKDKFYNRPQSVIDNFPERDVTILTGYFNAKIGSDNIGYEEVMGQHGPGIMNDNGERLDRIPLDSLPEVHREIPGWST